MITFLTMGWVYSYGFWSYGGWNRIAVDPTHHLHASFKSMFETTSTEKHPPKFNIPPWKPTCPLKINAWKMKCPVFGGHVNFRGGVILEIVRNPVITTGDTHIVPENQWVKDKTFRNCNSAYFQGLLLLKFQGVYSEWTSFCEEMSDTKKPHFSGWLFRPFIKLNHIFPRPIVENLPTFVGSRWWM